MQGISKFTVKFHFPLRSKGLLWKENVFKNREESEILDWTMMPRKNANFIRKKIIRWEK